MERNKPPKPRLHTVVQLPTPTSFLHRLWCALPNCYSSGSGIAHRRGLSQRANQRLFSRGKCSINVDPSRYGPFQNMTNKMPLDILVAKRAEIWSSIVTSSPLLGHGDPYPSGPRAKLTKVAELEKYFSPWRRQRCSSSRANHSQNIEACTSDYLLVSAWNCIKLMSTCINKFSIC